MTRISVFLTLTVVLLCTACGKKDDPIVDTGPKWTACFTANPTEFYGGSNVYFFNCTVRAVTYKWDFGDGTGSTDPEPIHYYDQAGIYRVSLTAYDSSGTASVSAQDTISVIDHPWKAASGTYDVTQTCPGGTSSYSITMDTQDDQQSYLSGIGGWTSNLEIWANESSFGFYGYGYAYAPGSPRLIVQEIDGGFTTEYSRLEFAFAYSPEDDLSDISVCTCTATKR